MVKLNSKGLFILFIGLLVKCQSFFPEPLVLLWSAECKVPQYKTKNPYFYKAVFGLSYQETRVVVVVILIVNNN